MATAQIFADKLLEDINLLSETLILDLDGYKLEICANSQALLNRLRGYFKHVLVVDPLSHVNVNNTVICLESEIYDSGFTFTDWQREPGKTGRKDAYFDLDDARLVLKVRTGMLFLQHEKHRIVVGPCIEFDNQVINFINAQYMNWLQQKGALICHASGLVMQNQGLAIAGFSGGGKSTLMLHMLESSQVKYLTNDRLFLSRENNEIVATGIPKLPRVNPGTIVNNPRLKPILSDERVEALLKLPKQELWHLEEKYDVDVEAVYAPGKIVTQANLDNFLILNWSFNASEPCALNEVNITERPELLKAVMKSPGPFYQFNDLTFYQDDMQQDPDAYLDFFSELNVIEATGKVDFEMAENYCTSFLSEKE